MRQANPKGPSRSYLGRGRLGLLLAGVALVLAACGGATPPPSGTPAVTLELVAENSRWDRGELTVVAGSPFAIRLENRDTLPHNVSVRGGPAPMIGEIFTGPAERTQLFAALPAGSYTFICDVHPEMTGRLTAD